MKENVIMPKNSTNGKYPIGYKVNHWTFLESPKNKRHKVLCRCDCGKEVITKAEHVITGDSTQCRSCRARIASTKHGAITHTKKPRLYRIWGAMKARYSPKASSSNSRELYYEKGVRVCEEWINDYIAFRNWALGNGYNDTLTIDRFPNPHGNYEPSNCRWATFGEQSRNHRDTKYFTAFGENKILKDWAHDNRCKVGYYGLMDRVKSGWPIGKAITTPSNTRTNYGMNKTLAATMEHTDGSMIAKVYSHIDEDDEHLRKILVD